MKLYNNYNILIQHIGNMGNTICCQNIDTDLYINHPEWVASTIYVKNYGVDSKLVIQIRDTRTTLNTPNVPFMSKYLRWNDDSDLVGTICSETGNPDLPIGTHILIKFNDIRESPFRIQEKSIRGLVSYEKRDGYIAHQTSMHFISEIW
jgi:hypothetical protein